MKRNMDLIRDVLIFAESQQEQWMARECHIGEWSSKEIVYHVWLAIDAGFLDGREDSMLGPDGRDYFVLGVTYAGHEFLDQIRNETVWTKIKSVAKEKGIDLSVDIVKNIAPKIILTLL